MRAHFADLVAEIAGVQREIAELTGRKAPGEQGWAGEMPKPQRPNRHASAELKSLYRAIAARCHPDKTDEAALHEIFLAARAALDAGAVDRMRSCHDAMRTGRSLATLRRDELRDAIARAERQRSLIESAPEVQALRKFREWRDAHGEDEARGRVRSALANMLAGLKANLAHLRNPPQAVHYVYSGTSTWSSATTTR